LKQRKSQKVGWAAKKNSIGQDEANATAVGRRPEFKWRWTWIWKIWSAPANHSWPNKIIIRQESLMKDFGQVQQTDPRYIQLSQNQLKN